MKVFFFSLGIWTSKIKDLSTLLEKMVPRKRGGQIALFLRPGHGLQLQEQSCHPLVCHALNTAESSMNSDGCLWAQRMKERFGGDKKLLKVPLDASDRAVHTKQRSLCFLLRFFLILILSYGCFACIHVCIQVCLAPVKARRKCQVHRTGVTDSWGLPCLCWELNVRLLEE